MAVTETTHSLVTGYVSSCAPKKTASPDLKMQVRVAMFGPLLLATWLPGTLHAPSVRLEVTWFPRKLDAQVDDAIVRTSYPMRCAR